MKRKPRVISLSEFGEKHGRNLVFSKLPKEIREEIRLSSATVKADTISRWLREVHGYRVSPSTLNYHLKQGLRNE